MKALKLLAIATLTLTTAAFAHIDESDKKESAEVKAQIFAHTNDMIFVQLENPTESKVKISIRDLNGVTLHSEVVKKDTPVLKRFDVSNLPSGVYSYKVSNDVYALIKKIEKK